MKLQHIIFLALLSWVAAIDRSASLPSPDLLGVAPDDRTYYKSSEVFKCKDGSKKFTKSQLNDDFCDCPDGTDEPGTSACPNGKFYCQNAGHFPMLLYSSRVNDGICDCCDGSDEHDGKVKCPNTCWEAGQATRDKLKRKIATYQEGVTIRKQKIEQAKQALAKDESELTKLKNDEKILKGLVQQLEERKDRIEKAEKEERERKEAAEQKEREEKEKKEAEERKEKEGKEQEGEDNAGNNEKSKTAEEADGHEGQLTGSTNSDKTDLLESSHLDQDMAQKDDSSVGEVADIGYYGNEESQSNVVEQLAAKKDEGLPFVHETGIDAGKKEKDASENTESLSREELGRLVASRWTGENTGRETEQVDAANDDDHVNYEESPKDDHDEESETYDSETEDDNQRYNDDETEDTMEDSLDEDHSDSSSYKSDLDDEYDFSDKSSKTPSWLEKIQRTVRSILQAVNLFQTPVNMSEAAHIRKEYDESSGKLSKIQSRISNLSRRLKHDFGPEKEFYSFYDKCLESKQNKYTYKICPFKQASQEEGHSTTRLGEWEKFEDSYRVMQFSNGDKCWNGPDRSLKVKLRCGLKDELTDVDEPSRCEYMALLSTPILCREEKLKELQEKLELMNKQQPHGHDEL